MQAHAESMSWAEPWSRHLHHNEHCNLQACPPLKENSDAKTITINTKLKKKNLHPKPPWIAEPLLAQT